MRFWNIVRPIASPELSLSSPACGGGGSLERSERLTEGAHTQRVSHRAWLGLSPLRRVLASRSPSTSPARGAGNRTALAATAGLSLLLAACFPEFATPIGSGEPADPVLIGSWKAAPKSDPDDVMLLAITGNGGGITLTLAPPDSTDEKPLVLKGRTGAGPGGTRFASLQPQGDDMGGDVGYLVFRYEPDGADIKVWSLDTEKLAAVVNAGKIAGTTTGQGTDTSVKITAGADEAAAYLESSEGETLFMTGDDDLLILTKATR
jgi:hypothetical protein